MKKFQEEKQEERKWNKKKEKSVRKEEGIIKTKQKKWTEMKKQLKEKRYWILEATRRITHFIRSKCGWKMP